MIFCRLLILASNIRAGAKLASYSFKQTILVNKPLKISLIIFAILIFLYITIKFGTEWYISDQLTKKINHDNQLFQVKIENTRFHLYNLSLDLYDIHFQPVDESSTSISGTIDHLDLGSISLFDFIFNGIIETEAIIIAEPVLDIKIKKSEKSKKKESSAGMFKQDIFDKIRVNKFLVKNADFDLSGTMDGNLNLRSFSLENIVLDSASMADKIPFNYDSAVVRIDSLSLMPDSLYLLSTEQVSLVRNQLKISGFHYKPQFQKSEYATVFPKRKPMYDVFIDAITMDSLHWKLPEGQPMQFVVGMLDLDSLNLQMYIDKHVPRDADKIRPMPSKALQQAPFVLTINQMKADRSNFLYQIQPKDVAETADLFFTNLSINATDISNDSSILANNPDASFNFDSQFMGAGNLQASFTFNMAQQDYPFSAAGNLQPMRFSALNQLLAPLMSIEVDGNLNNFTYNFSGNNETASGTVDMAYQNMQLVFEEKPGESAPILQALSSLVLDNNLEENNSSQAEVTFNKEDERSFFYYWWSGIRKGIKEIVLP